MKQPRCSMGVETPKCRSLALYAGHRCPETDSVVRGYTFMQLVAPSAVTIAVHTDAMI